MDCSMPGFPVSHYLPEFAQVHVHCIGDAIQTSNPLLPSSPSAFNLSQHQDQLFTSGGQSIRASTSASILPVNIQSWFPLGFTALTSLLPTGFLTVSSKTTVQNQQFFSILTSLWSSSHNHQFSSVAHSCLILRDPMDHSTPGFPVLQHLPELAQTHVHWVGDAIQPSHPLSCPSPPAFSISQHQVFF